MKIGDDEFDQILEGLNPTEMKKKKKRTLLGAKWRHKSLAEKVAAVRVMRKLERLRRNLDELRAVYHAMRGESSRLTRAGAERVIRRWLRAALPKCTPPIPSKS